MSIGNHDSRATSPEEEEFLLPGPLTIGGEQVLAEVERGVSEGRLPFRTDDVRLLHCTVQTIANLGQLLNVAAASDLGTLEALRERLQRTPGEQLRRDL